MAQHYVRWFFLFGGITYFAFGFWFTFWLDRANQRVYGARRYIDRGRTIFWGILLWWLFLTQILDDKARGRDWWSHDRQVS